MKKEVKKVKPSKKQTVELEIMELEEKLAPACEAGRVYVEGPTGAEC